MKTYPIKTRISHKLILFFFVIISVFSISAEDLSYGYDNVGNRVIRQVVTLRNFTKSNVTNNDTSIIITNKILQTEIQIFPNPTQKLLQIRFSNLSDNNKTEITLYNSAGVVMQNQKAMNLSEQIDLSNYPSGWYILRVKVLDKYKEFKIIKE